MCPVCGRLTYRTHPGQQTTTLDMSDYAVAIQSHSCVLKVGSALEQHNTLYTLFVQ